MDTLARILTPIHREGWRFIIIFAVATLVAFLVWEPLGWVGIVLTVWCVLFFRDPERVTPVREGLIVSPADGVVCMITEAAPPPELNMGEDLRLRVSIFMNVFNCHVNRAPITGKIVKTSYRPGLFINASMDKASEDNERRVIVIEDDRGDDIIVTQIAGLVARRIVPAVEEGDNVQAGERIGIIRFGSRVDVYLQPDVQPRVALRQGVVAGETIIADRTINGEVWETVTR